MGLVMALDERQAKKQGVLGYLGPGMAGEKARKVQATHFRISLLGLWVWMGGHHVIFIIFLFVLPRGRFCSQF